MDEQETVNVRLTRREIGVLSSTLRMRATEFARITGDLRYQGWHETAGEITKLASWVHDLEHKLLVAQAHADDLHDPERPLASCDQCQEAWRARTQDVG